MKLTAKQFFNHYIIHPFDKELSLKQKCLSFVLSILLSTWLFVPHIRCYLRERKIKKINLQHANSTSLRINTVASKTHHVVFKKTKFQKGAFFDFQPFEIGKKIVEHFIKPHYSNIDRNESKALFLEGDPSKDHGNDHAIRTSLFSLSFVYLYQKYHPTSNLTEQQNIFCGLLAAGYSSGKQSNLDGVNLEKSIAFTQQALKDMDIEKETLLKECEKVFLSVNSTNLESKSVYAKCIQGALEIENLRLVASNSKQMESQIEKSLEKLNIFQELERYITEIRKQNPFEHPHTIKLKGELTYGEFLDELKKLTMEMGEVVLGTHSRQFRLQALKNTEDYTEDYINYIIPAKFPALSEALIQTRVKNPRPNNLEIERQRILTTIGNWKLYGFKNIENKKLEIFLQTLKEYNSQYALSKSDFDIYLDIKNELSKRNQAENSFKNANTFLIKNKHEYITKTNAFCFQSYIEAYGSMSLSQKERYRKDFLEVLYKSKNTLNDIYKEESEKHSKTLFALALMEITHRELELSLNEFKKNIYDKHSCIHPTLISLENQALQLLEYYYAQNLDFSELPLNTASVCFRMLSEYYLVNESREDAQRILDLCAEKVTPNRSGTKNELIELLESCPLNRSYHLLRASFFLRHRKIRITKKEIDGSIYKELSFELPSAERKKLELFINLLPNNAKSHVKCIYERRSCNIFKNYETASLGYDVRVNVTPGVTLLIGNDPEYYNMYNTVRIRIDKSAKIEDLQKSLTKIGLPMVLFPSKQEDIINELRARSIQFRFPEKLHPSSLESSFSHGDIRKKIKKHPFTKKSSQDLQDIYDKLSHSEADIIDKDIASAKVTQIAPYHFEYVIPRIKKEALELGVKALGLYVRSPSNNFSAVADTMIKIMKSSFMSSSERWAHGLMSQGCCESYNFQTGSGNQVFARMFTKNLFESKFNLENLSITGPILVLFDPKLLERLPYFYTKDRGGIRNPNYWQYNHQAEGQENIPLFVGGEMMKERKGFENHIKDLKNEAFPLNEVMFNTNIGPKYINKLIVSDEISKQELMARFEQAGLYQINNIPLNQAIMVSSQLTPELIANYEENNPNEEELDPYEYL